jgi:hypothetical protein
MRLLILDSNGTTQKLIYPSTKEGTQVRRVLFALLIASCTLRATSVVFSSCSAGSTTLTPCPGDFTLTGGLSGPGYIAAAFASANDFNNSPAVPEGGLTVVANAISRASSPTAPLLSSLAYATDSIVYQSTGPERTGFIEFQVTLGYLHQDVDGAATAQFSDGVHQYSYSGGGGVHGSTPPSHCFIEDCEYSATVPFDLGTTFQVSVGANTLHLQGGAQPYNDEAQVTFSLFEADGTTPVAFTAVPEPSYSGLILAVALAGCFVGKRVLAARS